MTKNNSLKSRIIPLIIAENIKPKPKPFTLPPIYTRLIWQIYV